MPCVVRILAAGEANWHEIKDYFRRKQRLLFNGIGHGRQRAADILVLHKHLGSLVLVDFHKICEWSQRLAIVTESMSTESPNIYTITSSYVCTLRNTSSINYSLFTIS